MLCFQHSRKHRKLDLVVCEKKTCRIVYDRGENHVHRVAVAVQDGDDVPTNVAVAVQDGDELMKSRRTLSDSAAIACFCFDWVKMLFLLLLKTTHTALQVY
ncbi:hypothetical protein RND81_03G164500 [Saponaria officinalis]|uniref:Uncharacterized protein n=1 Tax=Saponaria officinalis TaxID=3572 RepID=A0AAW1M0R4_SAPOF